MALPDGGLISFPALGSFCNATLRISQAVYELKAVGEQTRDLLDTTSHMYYSVQSARTIRRQKSALLNSTEKKWIDEVLKNTEKAIGDIATLIEPARVDMQTRSGSVGLRNRGLFVLRDNPKVAVNLTRLSIASQSLNAAMTVLCNREGRPSHQADGAPLQKIGSEESVSSGDRKVPPTYEMSEFLNRRRRLSPSERIAVKQVNRTADLPEMDAGDTLPINTQEMQPEDGQDLGSVWTVNELAATLRRSSSSSAPMLVGVEQTATRNQMRGTKSTFESVDLQAVQSWKSESSQSLCTDSWSRASTPGTAQGTASSASSLGSPTSLVKTDPKSLGSSPWLRQASPPTIASDAISIGGNTDTTTSYLSQAPRSLSAYSNHPSLWSEYNPTPSSSQLYSSTGIQQLSRLDEHAAVEPVAPISTHEPYLPFHPCLDSSQYPQRPWTAPAVPLYLESGTHNPRADSKSNSHSNSSFRQPLYPFSPDDYALLMPPQPSIFDTTRTYSPPSPPPPPRPPKPPRRRKPVSLNSLVPGPLKLTQGYPITPQQLSPSPPASSPPLTETSTSLPATPPVQSPESLLSTFPPPSITSPRLIQPNQAQAKSQSWDDAKSNPKSSSNLIASITTTPNIEPPPQPPTSVLSAAALPPTRPRLTGKARSRAFLEYQASR